MGPALNVHTDKQMHAILTEAEFTDIDIHSDDGPLALQLAQARKANSEQTAPLQDHGP
jgi:hypothetical protein